LATSAKKITNFRWLNLFEIRYGSKSGKDKSWQMASRRQQPKCVSGRFNEPDAVIIVPFHQDKGRLVITREFRVPLAGYEIGFPAGLVDKGETIEEAVRRELFEETGLTVSRFDQISPIIYSSAGMTDESVTIVWVRCRGEASKTGQQGSEDIEIQFIDRSEARRLCRNTDLKFDAKAWLVLARFAETGQHTI
jgi:ADP-ribose pyrophosphatase